MATSTPIQIQLTAAGVELAEGGELTISALGKSFTFVAGVAQAVDADDWTWLKTRPNPIDGQKLFEVVPAAAVAKVPAASGPVPVPPKSPAASTPAASEASTDPTKETSGK